MKAIILAAGQGERLSEVHKEPKCLLRFNGLSLLDRHLINLKKNGVSDITIVVGYEKEKIISTLPTTNELTIHLAVNPHYKLGSVVSLNAATDTLISGEDVILMDADVLYDSKILEILVGSEKPNCLLMDCDFADGDEPVKVCLEQGKIVHFGRTVPSHTHFDTIGESVGFFKFSAPMATRLAKNVEHHCDNNSGTEPHENILQDLFLKDQESFSTENITGLSWIEIDFPEDAVRAQKSILAKIE